MQKNVKYFTLSMTAIAVIVFFTAILIGRSSNKYEDSDITSGRNEISLVNDKSHTKKDSIVQFAKSLIGTPYEYGQCTPDGFDCSGFVYYVYNKFRVPVSRSSYLMAEEGTEIDSSDATPGDLIFFRGKDINDPKVGHVGIVISSNKEPIEFIHSSSGKKKNGVILTKLHQSNYKKRYIKIKRYIN